MESQLIFQYLYLKDAMVTKDKVCLLPKYSSSKMQVSEPRRYPPATLKGIELTIELYDT